MFHKILFDQKTIINILEVQSSYPHEKDCYKIHVSQGTEFSQVMEYVPKSQVDLAVHLKVTGCRISKAAIEYFEEMWDQAYSNGTTDETMSNSEDI